MDKNTGKYLLYSEAWKLYCHEDNLFVSNNKFYIGIQSALLALIPLAAKFLFEIKPIELWIINIHGIGIFGLFVAAIGIFLILLVKPWEDTIKGGRDYINLRYKAVVKLESELDLSGFEKYGPALTEFAWRESNKENFDTNRNYPLPQSSIWASLPNFVNNLKIFYWVVITSGIILFVLDVFNKAVTELVNI